ncbi:MAG: ImmA/IrrE family metallo-endopeptidase [Desulfobacteraceae bacterium]|nr:ImmA/IrrE family metallo-endopeptidase [Desulfobacteraceae bacterium]MBC2750099.1 ImmA/IrrE family metallo-endopeptidase [Desulfobacteraceae bacterium]
MDGFGARLKAARKMAGMSQQKLADATQNLITKQAISKYEKGKMYPASDILIAISKTLGVKTGYFYRQSQVELTGLEFRKKSRLSKRDENRVKYQTLDFLERFIEIESVMGQQTAFINPLRDTIVENQDGVEGASMRLREAWGLGIAPVSNLMELLEDKGIRILEVDLPEEFDGLSAWAKEIPVITVNKNHDLVRKRLTIVHELAHLMLTFGDCRDGDLEKLCHKFAGAFLIPKEKMIEEIGPRRSKITFLELKKLKGIYGLSLMALMVRARNLGIINDFSYRRFFILANKMGWRSGKTEEPGHYVGREYANRFKQLVSWAVAEEIITMSKGAELMNVGLSKFRKEFQIAA